MPSFDYKCNECGHGFEVYTATLATEKNTDCPHCSGKDTRKIFHALNIGSVSKGNDFPAPDKCESCCHGGMCGH
ncbi:MAG: hypothetical protein DKM50_00495 [Candidatus Margulisiibacteriota bacterium]|nr:MAG: hypothetical protein A2X43_06385 [Candidatus Margulisbacteria bacterium GWD2_39_127]OGI05577.1 MAG: hypothetical protein A2X42_08765 [Candidatus Margulisbacteria bacterium GWF2_38_17]OGI07534.1 MAG: hypothetical protein A2X41_08670 [Candidatus Margulisbacteria bacterium GWE2_39_32]PZM84897.1 MAG: hypothetical protein DKM50_00495 [Candidatus Margulisiibacteriota bacterium]HAR64017.1 FmdB family transcriptional regulator [Candidatus Margulisiibacteriota bacterium]